MASLLRMPAISANMTEAVLNEWPLAESAAFVAGDPIATVETDKAVVDVPAESDGVLLRMLIEPGGSVAVGTPMAVLAEPGEVIEDIDALVRTLTGAEPSFAATRAVASPEVEVEGVAPDDSPTAPVAGNGANGSTAALNGGTGPGGEDLPGRVFASPLARRMAREHDLTISDLRGTGPGGRIIRDDVRRAVAQRNVASAAPSVPTSPAPTAAPALSAPSSGSGYEDVPHSRMRRVIATRLSAAARDVPVFTIRGTARVDDLMALRAQLNAAADVKISLNDLVVAAAARTHAAVPEMNAIWTDEAVRRFHDVDIAIAVATANGLVTPVVRGVAGLAISALARTSADLAGRARDGRLRQNELEGGSLTVTNLGVFGTEEFTAVINPPQAAILAVGAAREEAVVTDGALAVATVLRVALSVDHRPVDGALAARWMAHFLGLLEAPVRILV